jgi:hypothetical protein
VAPWTSDTIVAACISGINITPRLYSCRDAARLILGAEYPRRMAELGRELLNAATTADCDVLQAARAAGRLTDALQAMQLLAAVVELAEPSR